MRTTCAYSTRRCQQGGESRALCSHDEQMPFQKHDEQQAVTPDELLIEWQHEHRGSYCEGRKHAKELHHERGLLALLELELQKPNHREAGNEGRQVRYRFELLRVLLDASAVLLHKALPKDSRVLQSPLLQVRAVPVPLVVPEAIAQPWKALRHCRARGEEARCDGASASHRLHGRGVPLLKWLRT